jgi:hypothetical protein
MTRTLASRVEMYSLVNGHKKKKWDISVDGRVVQPEIRKEATKESLKRFQSFPVSLPRCPHIYRLVWSPTCSPVRVISFSRSCICCRSSLCNPILCISASLLAAWNSSRFVSTSKFINIILECGGHETFRLDKSFQKFVQFVSLHRWGFALPDF